MQSETRIDRVEQKINDFKEEINEIKIHLNVREAENKHIAEKLDEVLTVVKAFKDTTHQMVAIQISLAAAEEKIKSHSTALESLTIKKEVSNTLKELYFKYWLPLLVALFAGATWLIEMFFKSKIY